MNLERPKLRRSGGGGRQRRGKKASSTRGQSRGRRRGRSRGGRGSSRRGRGGRSHHRDSSRRGRSRQDSSRRERGGRSHQGPSRRWQRETSSSGGTRKTSRKRERAFQSHERVPSVRRKTRRGNSSSSGHRPSRAQRCAILIAFYEQYDRSKLANRRDFIDKVVDSKRNRNFSDLMGRLHKLYGVPYEGISHTPQYSSHQSMQSLVSSRYSNLTSAPVMVRRLSGSLGFVDPLPLNGENVSGYFLRRTPSRNGLFVDGGINQNNSLYY